MFSLSSSRAHSSRKRIFASAYSKSAIAGDRVQSLIKSRVAKIVNFLEGQTSSNKTPHGASGPVVIRNIFRALQVDIFTAFAFADGDGTNFLDHLKDGPNTLEDLKMEDMDLFHDEKRDEFFFWESEKPFKFLSNLLARKGPKSHERAQRWLMELIKPFEAKVRSKDPFEASEKGIKQFNGGVYEKLLFYKNPQNGNPLEWNERASEIMDHAVAGQDAVPAALEFIMRQISTHTNVQSRMRLELLTSLPLNVGDRTFAMIDTLSYLNAVVMEGLRLVNTISSYQTRVVPTGGCVVSGHYLPAGTVVAAQPYVINRQADVFPNPETFDPSRWLLPREEYRNLSKGMWTYSSGPRSCVGRELSLAIIKKVLVDIYTRYKTTLLEPDRTEKRPWEGADMMAEIRFENVLTCEDGEWIEKRAQNPLSYPVVALDPEPVRRCSEIQPNFSSFAFTPATEKKLEEAPICPSRRPSTVHVQFNRDSFTQTNEETGRQPPPATSLQAPASLCTQSEGDLRANTLERDITAHQHTNARAYLGQLYGNRRPSLVPSLLPLPLGAQGQKGGEQREEIYRRPSIMNMDEDDEATPLERPSARVSISRRGRPGFGRTKTAPERIDGVLQGN